MRASASPSQSSLGWSLILLLSLLTALDAMAIDLYLPAFPTVTEAFAVDPARVQQTLSVFLFGLAIGQGLYGPLLDRFGRRLPLLLGMALFCAASVMAAMASSIEAVLFARFLQALGAAAGLVAPRSVVADLCDVRESARIFSILMQIMAIAPIVAPILGSYLLALAGWRSIFWALALVGVVGGLWAMLILPETLPPGARQPLNLRAVVKTYWGLCRKRSFFAYAIAGGFILGSLFAYITVAPFIFIVHFGLKPLTFSLLFAANAVTLVISAQCTIILLRRVTAQKILLGGLLLHLGSGLALLLASLYAGVSVWLYFAFLALAISGLGFTFGTHAALTMDEAQEQTGSGSALMGLFQYLLGAAAGLFISWLPEGLVPLPLIFVLCGACAWLLCVAAYRARTQPTASVESA